MSPGEAIVASSTALYEEAIPEQTDQSNVAANVSETTFDQSVQIQLSKAISVPTHM